MCGISGFVGSFPDPRKLLNLMCERLAHRGPDGTGVWYDQNSKIGLAHARLAIIDLTETGSQPMVSLNGRYHLTFNGELYNHNEIKKDIEVVKYTPWIGKSDTEILIEAISLWGLTETLKKVHGMFAFALWDCEAKKLSLVRDRMGEKPLYYGFINDKFVFSSELKPLEILPNINLQIDRNALELYLNYSCVPAPFSIYQDIYKLEPGEIVTFNMNNKKISNQKYWSIDEVYQNGVEQKFHGSLDEAVRKLKLVLNKAIGRQLVSDVPLGAFLSGGIDSSLIVSLMQHQSSSKIRTFSIGFDDKNYDEAKYARDVANHLGTEHFDHYVSASDVLDVVNYLHKIYDEPFADASQIPTYLVCKIAKEHVTVCLSGDAGDELFGGYQRYNLAAKFQQKIKKIPYPVKSLLSKSIDVLPNEFWMSRSVSAIAKSSGILKFAFNPNKAEKIAQLLKSVGQTKFYHDGFMSHFPINNNILTESVRYETIFDKEFSGDFELFDNMMRLDLLHYLPNDILTKVDRAAMAVSLETRIPMLDHDVVEFAVSLPLEYKIRPEGNKWILKCLLNEFVPKNLIERPKKGFGVPISSWLKGPLRDWAEYLLEPNKLNEQGYFNTVAVRNMWSQHVNCKRDWGLQLWDILMFQSWLENRKATN